MPNLFNGFCYPDRIAAANAEISQPIQAYSDTFSQNLATNPIVTTNGGAIMQSFALNSLISGSLTDVYLTVYFNNPLYPTQNQMTILRRYPVCDSVGSTENSLGLTMADASSLFFAVIAVWAVAYSFKVLRRAM